MIHVHDHFCQNQTHTKSDITRIQNHLLIQTSLPDMFIVILGYVLFLVPLPSASQPQAALQLLRFRDSLPEASKSLLQWNPTTSASAHCSWPGVSCYSNETDFRVEKLELKGLGLTGVLEDSYSLLCGVSDLVLVDLSSNNFSGSVPTVLGNCSQLIDVNLNNNHLSGPIPPDVFKPGKLLALDLGGNKLSGTIPPEVGQCKRLEYLALSASSLSGEVPSELFSVLNLKYLYLDLNQFNGTLPKFPSRCPLVELLLRNNSFHGSLPPSISNCRDLQFLDVSRNKLGGVMEQDIFTGLMQLDQLSLARNNFEGQIPMSVWSLRNITSLLLFVNKFNGSIPEDIRQCDKLTRLDLSENVLTGPIPASVSYLRNLRFMNLLKNRLSGPIPQGIGNCTSLTDVVLRENNISGILPPELCGLRSLVFLMLNHNHIEGPIPDCVGSLISLQVFSVYNNSMTGRVPPGITKLTNLTTLNLAVNKLEGVIPSDLGKNLVPGLVILDLTGNQFTGELPRAACSGNRLQRYTLGNNKFVGGFPTEIIKCKSLIRLSLDNNSLQGSIPNELENSSSIEYFNIRGNMFEGPIPTVFGSWSNLSTVDLSDNKFSGSIPKEFGGLQNLVEMNISSNRLTGEIPPELSRCPKIDMLDLSKNDLEGGVPSEILSSSSLSIIQFQDNKLTGMIPNTSASGQKLRVLQLGDNLLEGHFPCNLNTDLKSLNLSTNKFSGEIPRCIGNLKNLEILDISSNDFSGEIPSVANDMGSLQVLNISYNQLSGQIPDAWAKPLEQPRTSDGNPRLCLASINGGNCRSHKKVHRGLLAGIITGSFFLTACLLAAMYVLVTRFWHHTPSTPEQSLLHDQSSYEDLPDDLKFVDILRGTEGWSDKYVIGRGKHGTVYRAQSMKSKKHWAIKKVDLTEAKSNTEMRILNLVRHRNILRMGGYSIRNGCGYIVTEYMPEGTLYHLLHKRLPRVALTWEQRCRIALGIAQGLSYLHHDCVPPIIHRDIKSDNVLLDSEFEPKIGDFGTAKLDSDVEEDETDSTIVGTLGYIAPENAYSSKLTDKCDVYSYGVILLELLCRKLPVDPSFDEGLDIVSWVRTTLHGYNPHVDFLDEEIMHWEREDQQEVLEMVDLALKCTEMVPDIRPSMRDVVSSLLKFQKKN
ncbi:leucine-rich repeat receptor-like protein kinase PEPR2 [Salvia hispanica]|uniref:leucine-rich repeat receptor-like protein kinase PEPR2 n=1 Tax=Salvia hispanica TaxID=49212 RepID=UPI00200967B1|nr:leucine-rich repeat receptor-like protein kinase PEPR2 [Salvia hispanica]